MSTVTENDLKELKDLILAQTAQIQSLGQRMIKLEEGQSEIKERLLVIETRLEEWKPSINKISDLTEKVGELKNWKQIGVVVITAMISSIFSGTIGGIIGWLIRSGKV